MDAPNRERAVAPSPHPDTFMCENCGEVHKVGTVDKSNCSLFAAAASAFDRGNSAESVAAACNAIDFDEWYAAHIGRGVDAIEDYAVAIERRWGL